MWHIVPDHGRWTARCDRTSSISSFVPQLTTHIRASSASPPKLNSIFVRWRSEKCYKMRNKTLRDRSINTSRIEWFHFFLPFFTLLFIIQFEVSLVCIFVQSFDPTEHLNEWIVISRCWLAASHFSFYLFRGFLPLSASKFNELLIEARWSFWDEFTSIARPSFESLRWFCDIYLPRRSNIIIESCCVVVYFLFSVEAIIFQ